MIWASLCHCRGSWEQIRVTVPTFLGAQAAHHQQRSHDTALITVLISLVQPAACTKGPPTGSQLLPQPSQGHAHGPCTCAPLIKGITASTCWKKRQQNQPSPLQKIKSTHATKGCSHIYTVLQDYSRLVSPKLTEEEKYKNEEAEEPLLVKRSREFPWKNNETDFFSLIMEVMKYWKN